MNNFSKITAICLLAAASTAMAQPAAPQGGSARGDDHAHHHMERSAEAMKGAAQGDMPKREMAEGRKEMMERGGEMRGGKMMERKEKMEKRGEVRGMNPQERQEMRQEYREEKIERLEKRKENIDKRIEKIKENKN